jgi:DNA-binding CsgD family transcriptional regulator
LASTDTRPIPTEPDALTRRELEVIRLIGEGLSGPEVARRLFRSPRTIENHLRAAYRKLRVHNRVEMIRAAERRGLLGPVADDPPSHDPRGSDLSGRTLEVIQQIDTALAPFGDSRYFGQLLLSLSETLRVRAAGIAEPCPYQPGRLTVMYADRGSPYVPEDIPASTSPGGRIMRQGSITLLRDAAARFRGDVGPAARIVKEAFVGLRLDDRLLGPVGAMWIADDEPLESAELHEKVLRLLAPRTAAQLALARTLDQVHVQASHRLPSARTGSDG